MVCNNLHNPEIELEKLGRVKFYERIRKVFEMLEEKVSEKKIRMYGTATWTGYRVGMSAKNYLNLEDIIKIAEDVGGTNHHFKVIQLPYNLNALEAFKLRNQKVGNKHVSILDAAKNFNVYVMASAPLGQGELVRDFPPVFLEDMHELTNVQKAIQFVRSTPYIGTVLVGMKRTCGRKSLLNSS